ncbi:hypothetical protein DACRYDRAFT_23474 [Dacryopinax primogenitus]|uniref:Uncharacterized protein n=1 Tax=Dacryopinax primogenitus (strain DJM 731) TaxID=1858805 RepID=M5FRT4_DACPD|nr:uncharacterized protein DACRYDRAFT_23474 [Dacryopinax primogenitus]EJT99935.1 hypothetical protein DACRYDRAFT_23474 [Dacryopinax primogenitus]
MYSENEHKPQAESTSESWFDQAQKLGEQAMAAAQPYVDTAVQKVHQVQGSAQQHLQQSKQQSSVAANNLQVDAGEKTDSAVREGHEDVEKAKQAGTSYVQQAAGLAGTLLAQAQGYVAVGKQKANEAFHAHPTDPSKGGSIMSSLESTTNSAFEGMKSLLTSAQAHLPPTAAAALEQKDAAAGQAHENVDLAGSAAKPYAESAANQLGAVQGFAQPTADSAATGAKQAQESASAALASSKTTAASAYDSAKGHVAPVGTHQTAVAPKEPATPAEIIEDVRTEPVDTKLDTMKEHLNKDGIQNSV